MTRDELCIALEKHKMWLNKKEGGERADLSYADLSYANLRNANLSYADLRNANLSYADLGTANLRNANLLYADLRNANLSYANLKGADLRNANLSYADLSYATLKGADLSYATLKGADLRNANLSYADLSYANLSEAILSDEEKHRLGTILKEPLIGYKKCLDGSCKNYVIVTLEIPKGAIVFSINGKKCRTNRAKVVEISEGDVALSYYSKDFQYKVGDQIEIDDFNLMYNVECASGIHFFKTRDEAENYEI